jgi:hypothetical protein
MPCATCLGLCTQITGLSDSHMGNQTFPEPIVFSSRPPYPCLLECCAGVCLQDERLKYGTEAQSFLQHFLRREPAPGELPLLLRSAHADAGKGLSQWHACLIVWLSAKDYVAQQSPCVGVRSARRGIGLLGCK